MGVEHHVISPEPQPLVVRKLLTLEQVAEITSVSVRTVKTWVASRMLASVLLGARCRRVDPEDLAEFIEKGRAEARRSRRRRRV